MKIAIFDDDHDYRMMLTEFIEDNGFGVETVDRPDKLTKPDQFDVFIIDVAASNAPKDRTAGIDYIHALETEGKIKPEALVIFISNFGRDYARVQDALDQIRNKYIWLDKPINYATLSRLIFEQNAKVS